MLLAIVIAVQLATNSSNPCADQLEALCKVSPYFCAGAYPTDLVPGTNGVPCWPERAVAPSSGPASSPRNTNSVDRRTPGNSQASPQPSERSGSAAPTARERFARAIQRLVVRTSTP